jgi:hypothetical protein
MNKRDELIETILEKIFLNKTNKYIFVYTPPKVGSTTLVSSLRLSLGHSYNIIHIHDDIMLSVLTGIKDVTLNEIISYIAKKGNIVYVIDVYRTPVERKMSEFFEKVSPYHFNNSEENICKYNINRIIERFNKVYLHIENDEHYFCKYDIEQPIPFNFEKKYSLQVVNNTIYIKLRLCDSTEWSRILSSILRTDIIIVDDYSTEKKVIGELYKKFKKEYRLPENYLEILKDNKYLNFYYSEKERNQYINYWSNKKADKVIPYTKEEYEFYIKLCLENQYYNDIQYEHYIDNGCGCNACKNKRQELFFKAKRGEKITEKIIHNEVITEKIKRTNDKILQVINHINSKKLNTEMAIKKNYGTNKFSMSSNLK